jgi:hypothetical protein
VQHGENASTKFAVIRSESQRGEKVAIVDEQKDSDGKIVEDWKTIHHALMAIAAQRADLDAKEAFWLREAIAQKIWRHLGMVSIVDYMERVLEAQAADRARTLARRRSAR